MTSIDADDAAWMPVRKVRTYEQVMAQIEERMLTGLLKAGDKLPSERELSVMLGVSRPSLREALRVLEALGIVEIRGGPDGGAAFVGTPGAGFTQLLKMQLALGHFSDSDILRTRIALEQWSVHEAAKQAQTPDIDRMATILDRMDAEHEYPEFNRLDAEFHVSIAQSTGNALLSHLMGSMRTAMHRQMIEKYGSLPNWQETAKTVQREHRAILDAVKNHQGDQASRLVTDHITSFYQIDVPAKPGSP